MAVTTENADALGREAEILLALDPIISRPRRAPAADAAAAPGAVEAWALAVDEAWAEADEAWAASAEAWAFVEARTVEARAADEELAAPSASGDAFHAETDAARRALTAQYYGHWAGDLAASREVRNAEAKAAESAIETNFRRANADIEADLAEMRFEMAQFGIMDQLWAGEANAHSVTNMQLRIHTAENRQADPQAEILQFRVEMDQLSADEANAH
ncbi:hypothetical protein M885DRAFT_565096 [Pelagophyceae sp. CCMP2097]|nr:hypothetical protein M885DRAFT_565096 [Pelagophyceae sp. CCMP2097]